MTDPEAVDRLRGLFQDLCAYTDSRLQNVDRLWQELEATIDDFRLLLDKPPKNDTSRRAVLSGTIQLDDAQYSINEDFRQGVLQVADALDLDELQSAKLFFNAQDEAGRLGRAAFICAVTQYHEQRQHLLESLRLILRESINDDENAEGRKEEMQEVVATILETRNPTRSSSMYARKCITSMRDIERRIQYHLEQLQRVSVVGTNDPDGLEVIEFQRTILTRQHEILGAIVCYLFKGNHAQLEDFRTLLDSSRVLDRLDMNLVHYIPPLIAAIVRYGSPESGSLQDARSLHQKITSTADNERWNLHNFHAVVIVLWLSEYSGWYGDNDASLALEGVDLDDEAERRSALFTAALADGAFPLILAICSSLTSQDWHDPARHALVTLLLAETNGTTLDAAPYSDDLRLLLMEHLEAFAESCIANMPDTVRRLKVEEDQQRLDLLESRERIQLGSVQAAREAPMHLEGFLVIIAFAYEHRPEAAEEFWTDPDGNLFGFLHWASKRQTVPRVSAFCEMLCAVSEGEECAQSAHRFLLEEGQMPAKKLKRSTSMSWAQMFAELQLYASRVGERGSVQRSGVPVRKSDPMQMSEPESPLMLACYLRLIAHMCRESFAARQWLLNHPSFDIRTTLLVLNCASIPAHLRASIFKTLEALMTERTARVGEDLWSRLDSAFSGGLLPGAQKPPHTVNTSVWSERLMFDVISNSFEESSSFVSLLQSLTTPSADSSPLNDALPFPEALGVTYRMPGIEPYVDLVLGQIFAKKLPELQDNSQICMLQWKCLGFISTCLSTFNENLVVMANRSPGYSIDGSMHASSLKSYIKLHPFSRTMEWLFNEGVAKVVFAASCQDVAQVANAEPSSVQVQALLKSIEVINLILDMQATYFDLVRPFIKQHPPGRRTPVATSSITSFEDFVSNHLRIIADLSRYCGTGHQALTVASLSLLKKLSSSRKLTGTPTSNLGLSIGPSKVIEMFESEADPDQVARSLVDEIESDFRELETGPDAPGHLIKLSVFEFLSSCLTAIPDRPNIAHILLGFSYFGNSLRIAPGSPFAAGTSLFHAILHLVQTYPLGAEGSLLFWMMRIKEAGLQVLKLLWSSRLASSLVVAELRHNLFLSSEFVEQPLVGPKTLWDGLPMSSDEFPTHEGSNGLISLLHYRAMLFEYAVTELRFASREGSTSIQAIILSTLMGNSTDVNGESVAHVNVFDLFDFADLDIPRGITMPDLPYLRGIDLSLCMIDDTLEPEARYDLLAVQELLELKRTELINLHQIQPSSAEEQKLSTEVQTLIAFVLMTNQTHLIQGARLTTLRSWVELVMVVVEVCDMDAKSKTTLILQSLQVVLSRLERAIADSGTEATAMARLVTTLMKNLESQSLLNAPGRAGDVVNDRLFQLFRVCVRGASAPQTPAALRDLFYTICSQYLARMTDEETIAPTLRRQSMQVVKSAGERFIELVTDDSSSGDEDSKTSALLLLNLFVSLAKQEDSTFVVDSLVRLNYLGVLVESVKNISGEVQLAEAKDVSSLLSLYNAQLSLLLQVTQTRPGAAHVVNLGLFYVIRQSQLFAADPDIGIDIDNLEALRQYYELLLSVIRIIISTVLSHGVKNQQILEHTRQFLEENRHSMVGIFKRYANIGGVAPSSTRNDLGDLVKSYVALITMAGFVDFEEEKDQKPGRRGYA